MAKLNPPAVAMAKLNAPRRNIVSDLKVRKWSACVDVPTARPSKIVTISTNGEIVED